MKIEFFPSSLFIVLLASIILGRVLFATHNKGLFIIILVFISGCIVGTIEVSKERENKFIFFLALLLISIFLVELAIASNIIFIHISKILGFSLIFLSAALVAAIMRKISNGKKILTLHDNKKEVKV
jgi:hypothetical protein